VRIIHPVVDVVNGPGAHLWFPVIDGQALPLGGLGLLRLRGLLRRGLLGCGLLGFRGLVLRPYRHAQEQEQASREEQGTEDRHQAPPPLARLCLIHFFRTPFVSRLASRPRRRNHPVLTCGLSLAYRPLGSGSSAPPVSTSRTCNIMLILTWTYVHLSCISSARGGVTCRIIDILSGPSIPEPGIALCWIKRRPLR